MQAIILEAMNSDGTGQIKIYNSSASNIRASTFSHVLLSMGAGYLVRFCDKRGKWYYLMDFEEIGPK